MNTLCKDCKWWGKRNADYVHINGGYRGDIRRCRHEQGPVGIHKDEDRLVWGFTRQDFGCIHHEEK